MRILVFFKSVHWKNLQNSQENNYVETPLQIFFYKYCEIFKNNFF